MCQVLGVSRSGYYYWCIKPESDNTKYNKELLIQIRRIYWESKQIDVRL